MLFPRDSEADLHILHSSSLFDFLATIAIVLGVSAVCYPFSNMLGYQSISLIFLLMVALLSLRFTVGPVILAAAFSALMWNFLFIPPRLTFFISKPEDILMVITYFAIAAVTGTLTARVRAREKTVRMREERTAALYALTKDLSSAKNQQDVARAAAENIQKFFLIEFTIFLSDLDGDFVVKPLPVSTYTPSESELEVPAWVHWNEQPAGKGTSRFPDAEATYYPLSGPRYILGVVGVKPPQEGFSSEKVALLENFIKQIASALDREFLNEISKRSIALAESERLYKTLFNCISHEIRTPLTALLGASESLQNDYVLRRPHVREELAAEIQIAVVRLNNIVQNLLAMTRLESGLLKPVLDWTDIHDVINASLKALDKELSNHIVTIDVSPSFPLMRLDFSLIEQVLVNLLRNASLYTPEKSTIIVKAYCEGKKGILEVTDQGPGFSKDSLSRVFDKFYCVSNSKSGGFGLGLSIARGLVEAHHGTITVENISTGGARFLIQLPIESYNTKVDLTHG
ncbi:MAG: DUF4118 domain-containing protein [bacterium]